MESVYQEIHQDLIDKCKKFDPKAQMNLYKLYYKGMYSVAYRILQNEADAEDAMQEAFIKAFGNLDKYRAEASFGSWLKRIVVNQSLDMLQKNKLVFDDQAEDEQAVEQANYTFAISETIEGVLDAMKTLSKNAQLVLNLFLIEGYDHQEIADLTGSTYGAIRTQYSRARAQLIEQLKVKKNGN